MLGFEEGSVQAIKPLTASICSQTIDAWIEILYERSSLLIEYAVDILNCCSKRVTCQEFFVQSVLWSQNRFFQTQR